MFRALSLAVLLCLPACRSAPSEAPPATCSVTVKARAGKPVAKAVGDGPDETTAKEAAWANACAALPVVDRPHCRDPQRFSASSVVVWKPVLDGKLWSVTLRLHPTVGGATAEVTGGDQDAACARATEEACKAAGDAADCVDSGRFERVLNSP